MTTTPRPAGTARLADVARHAGVSEATVSRVCNDKPGVSERTRLTVLRSLDVLGYDRPRVKVTSAGLVGLIVPELSNPVFPAYAQVIENILSAAGYTPLLCTQTVGGVHEDEYVHMLLERGVAGIIYVSGHHANLHSDVERYRELIAQGVPIVMVSGFREGVAAPFVSLDDREGIELAVAHLVALGHTRIGLLVGPDHFVPVVAKIEGFRRACARLLPAQTGEAGDDPARFEDLIVRSLFTIEGGAGGGEQLLDRGCTAIVCASDLMALGAIRAARRRGLQVPDDVSVVGHDDSLLMAFTDPPLTTVRANIQGMGAAAVAALLEQIDGRGSAVPELIFPPDLVVRGSTGPVPTGPASVEPASVVPASVEP